MFKRTRVHPVPNVVRVTISLLTSVVSIDDSLEELQRLKEKKVHREGKARPQQSGGLQSTAPKSASELNLELFQKTARTSDIFRMHSDLCVTNRAHAIVTIALVNALETLMESSEQSSEYRVQMAEFSIRKQKWSVGALALLCLSSVTGTLAVVCALVALPQSLIIALFVLFAVLCAVLTMPCVVYRTCVLPHTESEMYYDYKKWLFGEIERKCYTEFPDMVVTVDNCESDKKEETTTTTSPKPKMFLTAAGSDEKAKGREVDVGAYMFTLTRQYEKAEVVIRHYSQKALERQLSASRSGSGTREYYQQYQQQLRRTYSLTSSVTPLHSDKSNTPAADSAVRKVTLESSLKASTSMQVPLTGDAKVEDEIISSAMADGYSAKLTVLVDISRTSESSRH